jgi:hypothetical protein
MRRISAMFRGKVVARVFREGRVFGHMQGGVGIQALRISRTASLIAVGVLRLSARDSTGHIGQNAGQHHAVGGDSQMAVRLAEKPQAQLISVRIFALYQMFRSGAWGQFQVVCEHALARAFGGTQMGQVMCRFDQAAVVISGLVGDGQLHDHSDGG